MSFTLPDLVIEGAVRKGFDFLRNNAGSDGGGDPVTSDTAINFPVGTLISSVGGVASEFMVSNAEFHTLVQVNIPNVMAIDNHDATDLAGSGILVYTQVMGGDVTITNTIDTNMSVVLTVTDTSGSTFSFNPDAFLRAIQTASLNTATNVLTVEFQIRDNITGTDRDDLVNAFNAAGSTFLFTIRGVISPEDIGAGGALLNMLFNFDTGGENIDGGLDSVISRKYSAEARRIRRFFRNNEVAIIQSFSDVQTNLPCVSIQLANDGEDQGLANVDDFGGIDGTFGSEVPTRDRLGRDLNTIHANTTINLGIHTKEQLLTKYLYHITKYFILSAKEDLIRQNFIIATFRGSDFTRDAAWQGDHVYTRFLNISGKTEDSWVNLDEIVAAVEDIDVRTFVAQDGTNNTFVNGSNVFSNISSSAAQIQLANSVYFPDMGMAVIIQRDGTGAQQFQSSTAFSYTNDKMTGILTSANLGLTGDINIVDDDDPLVARTIEVRDVATGATFPVVSFNPTVATPPTDGLTTSQAKQNINDADDVIHRSNVDESMI